MSKIRVTLLTLLLVAAAVLTLTACGDDDDDGDDDAEATPTAAASPTAQPFGGGQDAIEVPFGGEAPPVCTLVGVSAEAQEGFDRAVFSFDNCLPGYRVEYVDEAVQCGSGETQEVDGAALLQVTANPAQAHDDAGNTTVPSLELTPGLAEILELQSICDFEGYVTWVLGLTARADFRVVVGEASNDLIIDVQSQ